MNAQNQIDPHQNQGTSPSVPPALEILPAPGHQQPAITRSRNGKIARLPKLERDMVNRMLQNNIPPKRIVGALDEVGIRVTRRNISNWKTRGGYKEWCLEENHAIQTRLHQDNLVEFLRKDDASQLPEVGLQLAATHLAEFMLKPEARQQLTSAPEKYGRVVASLCRLSSQIHTLQKYRDDSARKLGYKHDPEFNRREDEKAMENVRNAFSSYIPPNAPIDPEVPHRNFIPKNY